MFTFRNTIWIAALLTILSVGAPAFAKALNKKQASGGAIIIPCPERLASNKTYILPEDRATLLEISRRYNLIINVIVPNPASLPYSRMPGYAPKTADLKFCRSAKEGPNAGLVECPPVMFGDLHAWETHRAELALLGYIIHGPERNYLVQRNDGKFFYSDLDFFSVYHTRLKQRAYSEELRQMINAELGRRLVRHPPLVEYEHRYAVGIKFPIMTFTPHGIYVSYNENALKKIHKKFDIPWEW